MTNVLVVEPSPQLSRTLERSLAICGFCIDSARALSEASTALRRHVPDVLLCELDLEDGDGLQLLRTARERSPTIHAVLMSTCWTPEDRAEALALGARRILEWPFGPTQLIDAVRVGTDCSLLPSLPNAAIDVLRDAHRRRCTVRLVDDARGGEIHLVEGELVHARWHGAVGEAAMLPLLRGTLRPAGSPGRRRTIFTPFRSLVVQVLQQLEQFESPPRGGGGAA